MPRQTGLRPAGWLQQFQTSSLVIPSCKQINLSHKPPKGLPFYLTGQTDTIFKPITGKVNKREMTDVEQILANFSLMVQTINILGFAGHEAKSKTLHR